MYIDSVEREEEVIKKVYEKPNENWEVNFMLCRLECMFLMDNFNKLAMRMQYAHLKEEPMSIMWQIK